MTKIYSTSTSLSSLDHSTAMIAFKGATVLPLTTHLSGGDVRFSIERRGALEKNSEVCINELCTLDQTRINLEKCLTVLSDTEMREVEIKLMWHLGIK